MAGIINDHRLGRFSVSTTELHSVIALKAGLKTEVSVLFLRGLPYLIQLPLASALLGWVCITFVSTSAFHGLPASVAVFSSPFNFHVFFYVVGLRSKSSLLSAK